MSTQVKLVHISRRAEAVSDFMAPELRDRLATLGVRRVQVNVEDAAVADAQLRTNRSAEPNPVLAMITTWGDGATSEVTDVLREVADDVVGWKIDERTPLLPPQAPDGKRADGYAQVAFLRRPADLPHDQWLHNWVGLHTQVAIDTQDTVGYIQNVVSEPLTDAGADVSAVVEELYAIEAMTDWHAYFGSGGDDEEMARRMKALDESVNRFRGHEGIEVMATSRYTFNL